MSIFVKRYKARTDVAVKRGRCGGRWPVVGLVFSPALLSHEASGSFVMDQIAAIAAQLAATAGTAAADPAVQHFATMLVAGLGVGGVAVGLNLAFPASKPGPDYSKVLERGVFSEEEFAGACCAVVMMGNSCVTLLCCCAVVSHSFEGKEGGRTSRGVQELPCIHAWQRLRRQAKRGR